MKIIFIVKDFEDESKITSFEVEGYEEHSEWYDLTFNKNSWGSIPKSRVIRIEKYELTGGRK